MGRLLIMVEDVESMVGLARAGLGDSNHTDKSSQYRRIAYDIVGDALDVADICRRIMGEIGSLDAFPINAARKALMSLRCELRTRARAADSAPKWAPKIPIDSRQVTLRLAMSKAAHAKAAVACAAESLAIELEEIGSITGKFIDEIRKIGSKSASEMADLSKRVDHLVNSPPPAGKGLKRLVDGLSSEGARPQPQAPSSP